MLTTYEQHTNTKLISSSYAHCLEQDALSGFTYKPEITKRAQSSGRSKLQLSKDPRSVFHFLHTAYHTIFSKDPRSVFHFLHTASHTIFTNQI